MKIGVPARILVVAAVCAAGLIGMVARESLLRAGGEEVLLAMEAVDPRSLLSGHYVIVDLNERLEPGDDCPAGIGDDEATGWIVLAPRGDHHTAVAASPTRDGLTGQGAVIVRGSVFCLPPQPESEFGTGFPGRISLDIGIDRFHIGQDEAMRIEDILRESRGEEPAVYAIVSVGVDGVARLKGLLVEGERMELRIL